MRKNKRYIVVTLIMVLLASVMVIGCGEAEIDEMQNETETENLWTEIEAGQAYELGDGSVIYFETENRFVWYMDDSNHENFFYEGTYEVRWGEEAEQYILGELKDHDVNEEELQVYYSKSAEKKLYAKENLTCLTLHNEKVVFTEEEHIESAIDTNYMGFYLDGYYFAMNIGSREYVEFTQR